MSNTSYQYFISSLEKIFGSFDFETKKFSDQSNSIIARELFYSDSQFSRLINQTASEGEYTRANKIISRYTENLKLKTRLEKRNLSRTEILKSFLKDPFFISISIISLILAMIAGSMIFQTNDIEIPVNQENDIAGMDYMLHWAFELSDVKPYTELNDLPEDCNYPCYRLQGKWKLDQSYKIPVFSDQRGFHYMATDVNMYARCLSENNSNGQELEGYEYQKHEIWYDTKELPIDSFLIHPESTKLTKAYNQLEFSKSEQFVLVAHVHTFFRNVFDLSGNSIKRKGKVIGRYIEYEDFPKLNSKMNKLSRVDIQNEVNNIVNTRVEDFSRPIRCSDAKIEKASIYDIEEQDLLSFECIMTTGRVPISYQKTYYLSDQAIKNHCRPTTKS